LAVLDAYDSDCFRDARICMWPLDDGGDTDAMQLVANGDGAIVSSAFVSQFRVRQDDVVSLESPQGVQSFRVVGVTRAEPTAAIIMARERYRRVWGDEQFIWAHVALAQHASRAEVESEIRRRTGREYRLLVRSGAELIEYFANQARQGFQVLYLMEAITLGLLLIGIGDTLATGVVERTRQFGMMRAIGLHRSQLIVMVILEGLAIGVLGLLLALGFGLLLGTFWVEIQFPALVGWQLEFVFPSAVTVSAIALTVTLCLAGSVLPSVRASRLSIPAALRGE
jgi:putative ABC transport system permease protein